MRAATVSIVVAAACLVAVFPRPGEGQAYKAPRTASGQPDLNGFWQALNTAHWDLEAHEAAPGAGYCSWVRRMPFLRGRAS